jgi:outer membrane protein TolC
VAELGVAQGECDLRLQVVQAFYGAILAKEYHQMMVDTKAQIESHLKNVQAMYEQGMVSEYDKLRAEVELANFSPQVTSAEEAWKMALEGLRMVLGLAPQDEFEPVGELAEITPKEVDINKAIDEAFSNRADYRQIGLRTQMLQQALKVEKRNQYWPSFFLSVNYQKQAQEKNLNFDEYFWGEGLSVGIACSIPLFDGFKTHNRIQMAKLNVHKAELMKSQAEDGIRIEIKQAVWKLEEASEKLQASQQAVQQAEKGYSIAEVRYQSGISTQVELLDARLSGTQAQISELSARYDLIVAKASLERAIGMKPLTH